MLVTCTGRVYRRTGSTHASLDSVIAPSHSGRFTNLELPSADRHVAIVTARVQATAPVDRLYANLITFVFYRQYCTDRYAD